jgi:hypothetical protein
MKKVCSILPMLALFAIPMAGQADHAVTPEQCRADATAWGLPSTAFTSNAAGFTTLQATMVHSNVSARLLDARVAEFAQCEKTDARHEFAVRYEEGTRAYQGAEMARILDFMNRHKLTAQFYQEDDEGQR